MKDAVRIAMCHSRHRSQQRGATAVEFALVFPLFFTVLYAIVTYSLIFVAQQNLTLASEEGARAALNYQKATTVAAAVGLRAAAACTTATNMIAGLIRSVTCTSTPTTCSFDATMQCIAVTLTYNYAANPLVPTLLPPFSLVLPNTLTSTATVQLNPVTLL
jgi:Flp pilus assembly protein TadG